ncbi:MurR/RpiR family transcriptional regulator [Enterococcus olivae]
MENNQLYSEIIKLKYNSLSKTEKKVADFILDTGYQVSEMALSELSGTVGVSDPSVVRFTKALGFKGYSDFKSHVLRDWGKESSSSDTKKFVDINFSPNDTLDSIPEKIIRNTIQGLEDTLKIFNTTSYQEAVKAILQAQRIEVFGVGTSGSIALDFVSKLIRIGLNARFFTDNHLEQLSCVSLSKNDVAIAISHSGSTIDVVDTLQIAKEAGAKTIALTNYKASHISKYADIELLTGDHETTFYSETMISRTSLLSIVDMLYMGILISDYENFTSRLHKVNILVEKKNF